ncbi:Inositol-pentakisphosphate 2-kinase [Thoreauomyces humboldtii]|nr:Inositol-pentakisphosphate 2-kinase [Thoreauomyces humboldtii]
MNEVQSTGLEGILSPDSWKYKGEGNANIVLSYVGSFDILVQQAGKVLRVRKAVLRDKIEGRKTLDEGFSLEYERCFQQSIIASLVGREYVGAMRLVLATRAFLEALSRNIANDRPGGRLVKDIDPNQEHVALIDDLTFISNAKTNPSTIAVELKHAVTKFCPLDLYSKEPSRVRQALDDLAENPQNNMKLFVDGQLVGLDAATVSLASFFGVVEESSVDTLSENLATIIIRDRLLSQLQRHQKGLDAFDIEVIAPWYADLPAVLRNSPTSEEWMIVLERYKARIPDGTDLLSLQPPHLTAMDEILQAVRQYTLAATLKDCSVMITLWRPRPEDNDQASIPPNEGAFWLERSEFRYRVSVLDIDPKRMDKIPAYLDLDRLIVR